MNKSEAQVFELGAGVNDERLSFEFYAARDGLPTAIILPSIFAGPVKWRDTVKTLVSNGYGAAIMQQHGASLPRPTAMISDKVDRFIQAVAERAGGFANAHLVGGSAGGLLALEFARRYLANVGQHLPVVLVAVPGLDFQFASRASIGGKTIGIPSMRESLQIAQHFVHSPSLTQSGAMLQLAKESIEQSKSLAYLKNHAAFNLASRAYPTVDVVKVLATRISMIWGDTDRISPLESWMTAFAEEIESKKLTLDIMPKCGHLPMLEYPEIFAELLMQTLIRNHKS
jgi:pimeloyl-ACP methyl ester carboxylesterase